MSLHAVKDPQEMRWQAESDARTLREALQVQADPERLERALTVEAETAAKSQALLHAYGSSKPSKADKLNARTEADKQVRTARNLSFADKIALTRRG